MSARGAARARSWRPDPTARRRSSRAPLNSRSPWRPPSHGTAPMDGPMMPTSRSRTIAGTPARMAASPHAEEEEGEPARGDHRAAPARERGAEEGVGQDREGARAPAERRRRALRRVLGDGARGDEQRSTALPRRRDEDREGLHREDAAGRGPALGRRNTSPLDAQRPRGGVPRSGTSPPSPPSQPSKALHPRCAGAGGR